MVIFIVSSVSISSYYFLNKSYENLENQLDKKKDLLKDREENLTEISYNLNVTEEELADYQKSLQENLSKLDNLTNGDKYNLYNPTYNQTVEFIQEEESETVKEVVKTAKAKGMRCAYAIIDITKGMYRLVAFETVDKGIVYFEADTDFEVKPKVGKNYFDCIVGKPYSNSSNETIGQILLIW